MQYAIAAATASMKMRRDGKLRDLIDQLQEVKTLLENVAEDQRDNISYTDISDAERAVETTIHYLRDLRCVGDVA
jgi:hypothetical protein